MGDRFLQRFAAWRLIYSSSRKKFVIRICWLWKILALDFLIRGINKSFYYKDNDVEGYYKLSGESLKRGF